VGQWSAALRTRDDLLIRPRCKLTARFAAASKRSG
jgi:hypothetical protein